MEAVSESESMKQLIVNADDFGLTEKSAEEFWTPIRMVVTSATLLANGDVWETAVAASKQAPRFGVGVYLSVLGPTRALPGCPARDLGLSTCTP